MNHQRIILGCLSLLLTSGDGLPTRVRPTSSSRRSIPRGKGQASWLHAVVTSSARIAIPLICGGHIDRRIEPPPGNKPDNCGRDRIGAVMARFYVYVLRGVSHRRTCQPAWREHSSDEQPGWQERVMKGIPTLGRVEAPRFARLSSLHDSQSLS